MLRPRARLHRPLFMIVPALLAVGTAGCGDDDDADPATTVPTNTVTVGLDGTGPAATGSNADNAEDSDDESNDDEPTQSTHDIPTLEEVGRAEFTHTVVAGDFLRKIADTYGVEIDDIVGANEWGVNGREHLLLPGDEVYLPADAVMPEAPDTTTAGATDSARDFPEVANVVWPPIQDPPVCTDDSIQGEYAFQVGDTTESLAATFGITPEQLLAETNQWTDLSDLRAGDTVPVCASWF